jgi:hypothetical protein
MTDWPARSEKSWEQRLADWLEAQDGNRGFLKANVSTLKYWLNEHGIRIVVNAGAYALQRLLEGRRYKNRYELGRIGGDIAPPSQRRIDVDRLIGFEPDGRDWYFGAVAVGGTGVRFYGEYCLVLKRDSTQADTFFLDRNSYDLLDPPLQYEPDKAAVVRALRADWQQLPDVIALKVLPAIPRNERLVTVGLIAEFTLRDEDFIEVHLHRPDQPNGNRSFGIGDVEEVRLAPEEVAQLQYLMEQQRNGRMLTEAERVWCNRRAEVERLLDRTKTSSRVVTTEGRGTRWR